MSQATKSVLFLLATIFVLSFPLFVGLTWEEHSLRRSLEPEMQTQEMIQQNFDGAVCLGCDMVRLPIIAISFVSAAGIAAVLLAARLRRRF